MNTPITVAIAGAGGRGKDAYGKIILNCQDRIKVVAVADLIPEKVEIMAKKHNISPDMCFKSAEEMLEKPKLADAMFICTQDRDHYLHAIKALEKGYHLLLEKPISPDLSECKKIAKLANQKNLHVVVCHVLRYTPFYKSLKGVIESGVIGDIVTVNAEECVGYWHQAHSFVRGNWRSSKETSPMILAKCCHDMDILLWLVGKKCLKVSSFGSLKHFKSSDAPKGSSERCADCDAKTRESCPYDCEKIYITGERGVANGYNGWPVNIVSMEPTVESVKNELSNGPYGRCVYHCDNDVVDNQIVNMLFEGNVTLNFTMSAFTKGIRRTIRIRGTRGEIIGDMEGCTIDITEFGKKTETIDTRNIPTVGGHGGGDGGIINGLIELLTDNKTSSSTTTIDKSIESHFVALAAEESRLNEGAVIDIDEWMDRF